MLELQPRVVFAMGLGAIITTCIYLNYDEISSRVHKCLPEEYRGERKEIANLSSLLEPIESTSVTSEPLPLGRDGMLVNGLLSRKECLSIIKAGEKLGFGCAAYDKEYRGNLRLLTVEFLHFFFFALLFPVA